MAKASSRDLKEYLDAIGYTHATKRTAKEPTQTIALKATSVNPSKISNDDQKIWADLQAKVVNCPDCKLCKTRTQTVFEDGDRQAELMFVGEGPGEQEDLKGVPFVGKAGQLLTKMIEAMGLSRDKVYIANVVKCRPPDNRNPQPDEIAACSGYLKKQVELVSPKIIVALGTFAAQTLLETETPIGKLRGKFHSSPNLKTRNGEEVRILPTYHPAFCLRNPDMKKPVWEDLQKAMTELGLKARKV